MTAASFRKKPVEIEAMHHDGSIERVTQILNWINGGDGAAGPASYDLTGRPNLAIYIETLEGVMRADVGDWIIRGVQGEFYPCKPDIFEQTYVPAGEPTMSDLIAAERARQIEVEGYTAAKDAGQASRLLLAAVSYAVAVAAALDSDHIESLPNFPAWELFPWPAEFWKPTADPVRSLEKAGALIAAAGDDLLATRRQEGGS